VNVNVTLIFGLENYKAVADAYLTGLDNWHCEDRPFAAATR